MSNFTVRVIHTIDPTSLAALSALLAGKTEQPLGVPVPPPPTVEASPPQPIPQQTPVAPPVQQTPPKPLPTATIPTAVPTFTIDQISQAAALFAETSPANREAVLSLMQKFGAEMITAIPQEQYGAFATELRALGAKI